MKKFYMSLIIISAIIVSFSTGCSKSENALIGAASMSGIVGGVALLKGHVKRCSKRKHDLFNYKYVAVEADDS